MRIDRDRPSDGPMIAGFSGGGFKVDANGSGGIYRALLITPERADGWSPPPIDTLAETDLAPLLTLDPPAEFILLGTGASLVRPSATLVRAVEAAGSGIEAMDSRAAARAWAVLRGEGRWIAGALYPL